MRAPARAPARVERVVLGAQLRGAAAEAPCPVRPDRGVAAGVVEVPARAAGAPDGAPASALELGVVAACASGRISIVSAPRSRMWPQRGQHVRDLRLDHVDHRAVPEPGVRAEQEEQVREAGDRRSPGTRAGCRARRRRAACRRARGRGGRPGCRSTWKPVPNTIASTCALDAVGVDDRVRAHLPHAGGDELDVSARRARGTSRWTAGSACSRSCSRASPSRAARDRRSGCAGAAWRCARASASAAGS